MSDGKETVMAFKGLSLKLAAAFATSVFLSAGAFTFVPVYAAATETPPPRTEKDMVHGIGGGYAASGQLEGAGYSAQLYDATSGLPTSDANYILGATDGYMWIGAYSGIIRYDGSVFERLTTVEGLTSGRGLFEDSKGRIWVGTNDNGVIVIDKAESTHLTYKDGLVSSSIREFAEDRYGNVYIGTTAGVDYVDEEMKVHHIDDDRINNERVLKLETDFAGVIYGHTRSGKVFTIADSKVDKCYEGSDLGIGNITTILIRENDPGKIWYGTADSTVYYGWFGDKADKLRMINVSPCESVHWMNYDCGKVWVSSTDSLGFLDKSYSFNVINDLPVTSGIEMVTSDYQGNLWVASSSQGVMKIVTNNFSNLTGKSGLPDEVVNATCIHDGKLYVGTETGLRIINGETPVEKDPLIDYLGDTRIRCIMEDVNGNLWLSSFTHDLGLVCLKKDGSIKAYTTDDGMPGNEIRCTGACSDGSVIVGTNTGLAVIRDDKVVTSLGADSGMRNTVFLTVAEGPNGIIYAGTDGDGMYVINGTDIEVIGRDQGLTSDVIMRIKKDEDKGIYWVVTSNSIQFMKDGVLTQVTTFPYNNNYDVYYDNEDNLWVLSSFGVYSVSKEQMLNDNVTDFKLYTIAGGLPGTPTSNSYSALDNEGNLYISERNGVGVININEQFDNMSYVKTAIRSIMVNNLRVMPGPEGTYAIPPEPGRIQISPAVLDYTMSDPLVHVFLEGSDDDGITADRSRLTSLEYTGLSYGDYVLHIQILANDGVTVIQDDQFKIIKMPRMMELLVVRVLLLVLLSVVVGLIVWRVMTGTVIRKQYEEIRQARDEAERANSAKSRFLANMSHEIRTPINTIMGMDEMILREDAADVPQRYFMSVVNYALDIRNASESLLGLINDLLDMSRIESGKMNLVEQEYDISELLRSIVSMIRVRAQEKDLSFDVTVDEMIPMRLFGDSGKIKQIVLNVLTNAVKYTDLGGFTLTVMLDEREDDNALIRFAVKDTGIGIKEEDMDKLFTAYERLDEERNSGIQGTGLGLDISRRFAELMGGKLSCNSVYGEGSEFVFTVNQRIVDATPAGKFIEHEDEGVKGPYVPMFVAPDADVLVVDDNPMNLNVIKGLLKATRMFVTTADSGEECLEKLKYGTFNVVLLDHMMPGMDGVETVGYIRESYPDLPVYALTANSTAGEEFYLEKGFTGYLSKPIDSRALESAIMRHLPNEMMMTPSGEDIVMGGANDSRELSDDMLWIKDVEGINVDEGIKNSGGAAAFVNSVKLFYDTIDDNTSVIEDALKTDDIRLYTVKVHSLKTSARIVGALGLSELAQKLEDAGNKEDRKFISDNNDKLLVLYRAFREKFARIEPAKEEAGSDDKQMIQEDELKDAYNALKEVIPQMDYDAVEMILDQVHAFRLPDEDDKRFEELDKMLRTFKWDEMEELIKNVG